MKRCLPFILFYLLVCSIDLFAQGNFVDSELPLFLKDKVEDTGSQTSLGDALNADGTLKDGVEGSFSPENYTMSYGAEGKPVFTLRATGDNRWQALPNYQGMSYYVGAIVINGSNVYVGGSFENAGGIAAADRVALWNGSNWTALGNGIDNGLIRTMALVGTDLYVGGFFTFLGGNNIAKWNGSSWSSVGGGLNQNAFSMAVIGSTLYVGGLFTDAGNNSSCDRIAMWNGSNWSPLNTGLNNDVHVLAASGSNLYVGGGFTNAGGNGNADGIAMWNGSWNALGTGIGLPGDIVGTNVVSAIAIAGSSVYVGGYFSKAGGNNAANLAVWNGSSWSEFGGGMAVTSPNTITEMTAIGSNIYIGAHLSNMGGNVDADYIGYWNTSNSSWNALGSGLNYEPDAMVVSAGKLYLGGSFTNVAGNELADYITIWNGSTYTTFGPGVNGNVHTIKVNGSNVYVGGEFVNAGGNANADYIAVWNGTSWESLGTGVNGPVRTIEFLGSDVYAGGDFTIAGGVTVNRIARWNGTSWSALGAGLNNLVYGIAIDGTNIYAAGQFTNAGNDQFADKIARWDGTSWSSLGGITGLNEVNYLLAVAARDGKVYIAGGFDNAGGVSGASYIACWNGSAWQSLGGGVGGGIARTIFLNGTDVYIGGDFTYAGGAASKIARWDGTKWNSLGAGLNGSVRSIYVSGSNVYAAGLFTSSSGNGANYTAVWNGNTWSGIASGVNSNVNSLTLANNKAYLGGEFTGSFDLSYSAMKVIQRNGIFPSAALANADVVSPIEVKLNGTISAGNLAGNYRFEWGTASGSPSSFGPTVSMSSSANNWTVNTTVSMVVPNAKIYYRIRIENTEGVSYSDEKLYIFPSEIEVKQNTTSITSGGEYNFGNINYLSNSDEVSFNIYNLGLGNLSLAGSVDHYIIKGGTNSSDFTIVQSNLSSPVVYNNNQSFTIKFTPSAGGIRTAAITISSNDPDEGTYVINLKGTGTKISQSIAFNTIPVKTMGDVPFTLPLTASSGLTIDYLSTNTSIATVSGNTVTLSGPGTTIITASQAGDENYNAATNVQQTLIVRAVEPSSQPSALNFRSITASTLGANFTSASGSPSGYIVLAKANSSSTDFPQDGTSYSIGNNIGSSTLIYSGNSTSFNHLGLSPGTTYYYDIFAYNGTDASINYNIISPLEGSIITRPASPIALEASNPTTNSFKAKWSETLSAISYELDISTSQNFETSKFVTGYSGKIITGLEEPITGLLSDFTYYYRIRAKNASGLSENSNIISITTSKDLTAQPLSSVASNINAISSKLESVVNPKGTTTVFFEWGTTTSFGNKTSEQIITGTTDQTVSALLTDLNDNTLYYFRAVSINSSGTVNGTTSSFTTLKISATTGTASSPTATSMTIDGTINPNGSATRAYFEWGTTTTLGNKTTEQKITGNSDQSISTSLTGLIDNTIYYFRAVAVTSSGIVTGSIASFTTLKVTATTGGTTPPTLSSVTIDGTVNTFGATAKVYFDWGTTTSYENKTDEQTVTGTSAQTVSANLTDLQENTTYNFRITAISPGGTINGINGTFTTLSNAKALSYVNPGTTAVKNADDYSIAVSLQNGAGPKEVKLFYKGIAANTFENIIVTSATNDFQSTINKDKLDKVGLEYYFTASDATVNNPIKSATGYIYTSIAQAIPNLSFGGEQQNYRIISIPAVLSNADPRTVFNSAMVQFGGYDINKWRLIHYEPGEPKGKNVDFESLTQIQSGSGYWFNSTDKIEININGTAVNANQSAPFQLNLKKGWNQIGNPYTFNISWSDILALNGNPSGLGTKFYEYDASKLSFKQNDIITAWRGGFIKATAAITLDIPVTVKQTTGGRKAANVNEIENHQPDQPEWFLPIHLSQGDAYNEMGGLGMHPDASLSNDRYDEQSLPRFQNYLELNSYHPEFFLQRFTRDVVPTLASYTWEYTIESNFGKSQATLTWDAQSLGNNGAQLKLYDEEVAELIDMKRANSYSFTLNNTRKIKIFYSADEKDLAPDISGMGKPYPNPFSQLVTVPFFTGNNSPHIQIIIYDLTGRKVKELINQKQASGFYQLQWDGHDEQGNRVANGVYLYRFTSSDSKPLSGRLVIK